MKITLVLIAQVIITLIFAMAIMPKLAGKEMAKDMFKKLWAEPHWRYLTALLEITAVILIWLPWYLSFGASLAVVLMTWAIGSHLTKLWINKMFYMWIAVLIAWIYIISQVGLPL